MLFILCDAPFYLWYLYVGVCYYPQPLPLSHYTQYNSVFLFIKFNYNDINSGSLGYCVIVCLYVIID